MAVDGWAVTFGPAGRGYWSFVCNLYTKPKTIIRENGDGRCWVGLGGLKDDRSKHLLWCRPTMMT